MLCDKLTAYRSLTTLQHWSRFVRRRARTGFGSSKEFIAVCVGSCRVWWLRSVTCSKQALYIPATKSGDGLTSCSCETESPHPDRAAIISGIDIEGNQYCPAIADHCLYRRGLCVWRWRLKTHHWQTRSFRRHVKVIRVRIWTRALLISTNTSGQRNRSWMSTPKNNLEDVLRRQGQAASTLPSVSRSNVQPKVHL